MKNVCFMSETELRQFADKLQKRCNKQAGEIVEWEQSHKIRVDLLAQVYRCNGANLCDGCKHELKIVLKQYKPNALK